MAQKLKRAVPVWRLARDLGINTSEDAVADILTYCERRVKRFLRGVPQCHTLTEFQDWVAEKLGVRFELVNNDTDLERIKQMYVARGERIFANLARELASDDSYGITYKLTNREGWEPQFVSIIDCRGPKLLRAYFTKWHELAHLLTLTDQMRLSYQRSHVSLNFDSPEEALMEVIAGHFGFYSEIAKEYIAGEISFEAIEAVRKQLCPDASQQASLIGFVKTWTHPCLLLRAELARKKRDEAQLKQGSLGLVEMPVPSLRAVHVTINELARKENLTIFENMRVPENSVIHRVFEGETAYAEAVENLSWWESSDGTRLVSREVKVKAKRSWDFVDVLILPSGHS
jgi:hypothetical protein